MHAAPRHARHRDTLHTTWATQRRHGFVRWKMEKQRESNRGRKAKGRRVNRVRSPVPGSLSRSKSRSERVWYFWLPYDWRDRLITPRFGLCCFTNAQLAVDSANKAGSRERYMTLVAGTEECVPSLVDISVVSTRLSCVPCNFLTILRGAYSSLVT